MQGALLVPVESGPSGSAKRGDECSVCACASWGAGREMPGRCGLPWLAEGKSFCLVCLVFWCEPPMFTYIHSLKRGVIYHPIAAGWIHSHALLPIYIYRGVVSTLDVLDVVIHM